MVTDFPFFQKEVPPTHNLLPCRWHGREPALHCKESLQASGNFLDHSLMEDNTYFHSENQPEIHRLQSASLQLISETY